MELRPLGDRVIVKPLDAEEKTKSGLYIPDTAKEKRAEGEVMAVGPGKLEEGKRIPPDVKKGDKVVYSKYAGTEFKSGDEELVVLEENDILGVIE